MESIISTSSQIRMSYLMSLEISTNTFSGLKLRQEVTPAKTCGL